MSLTLRHSCKAFVLILLTFFLSSCSVSKRIERRGGYILTRNVVKTDRPGISQTDILNFAQPKPNKKFLGLFRSKVWMWDAFGRNSKSRFNRWVIRNFSEPPVLLDTILVNNSLVPMRQYLSNKGYFGADILSSVTIKRGKATVTYTSVTPEPWKVGEFTHEISDDTLAAKVYNESKFSLIKEGEQYDAYKMTAERDRITQLLRNNGYYAFTSDFIYFEVDTVGKDKLADIKLVILNRRSQDTTEIQPSETQDFSDISSKFHQRYRFNNIYIHTDYPGIGDTIRKFDTLVFSREADAFRNPDFLQIYRKSLRLRPEALARAVFVKPDDYYSQRNVNLTYNRIQNLGLSSYVSVNVKPVESTTEGKNQKLLDMEVRMVRAPVNGFTIEAEGTNADGLMGLGGSLNFRNRNIFVGAETFRIRTFGAIEIKPKFGVEDENAHLGIFNSLAGGVETGLDFPTLLSPFPVRNLFQNARPKTTLALGYNYESRSGLYERNLSKFTLSYEWNASDVSRHFFSPVDLSSISINRDPAFTEILLNLKDPRFFNQYTNHLILAMKYSYVFNNQALRDRSNFFYFRINLEPAGNMFQLFSNITNASKDEEGRYTLFGLKFAQYFRIDWDLRYYKTITMRQRLVYRLAFGIGVPYGNSISLPFEKGFFAGGANGMRGWPVRSLGPGEYYSEDENVLENVGDLWSEANIEYRFPIYSFFNGSLFADLGNIWLLHEDTDFPGGKFNIDRLLNSLALNTGAGIRFDFSLFVFRIDGGLPLYDPGKPEGDRHFKPKYFQLKDINWNFGIGYPF